MAFNTEKLCVQSLKIRVSATDTTGDYLINKLVAGSNITLTKNNAGGNETLTIAAAGSGLSFLTAGGAIDGTNTVFSFTTKPTMVVTDIGIWVEDPTIGFTWSAPNATLPIAPSNWVIGL